MNQPDEMNQNKSFMLSLFQNRNFFEAAFLGDKDRSKVEPPKPSEVIEVPTTIPKEMPIREEEQIRLGVKNTYFNSNTIADGFENRYHSVPIGNPTSLEENY